MTILSTDRDPAGEAALRDASGRAIPLVGSRADVTVDEIMTEFRIGQTYRNDSPRPVEAVYTFPLPFGAAMLGMTAEIDGRRLSGTARPRDEAADAYDDAVADGHGAVLLEQGDEGLCTANLGNLLPGKECVLEFRYALLHVWNGDVLRVVVPTVVGTRYGDPEDAGLGPREEPEADLAFRHPLDVGILLKGRMAQASVECPSHDLRGSRDGTGLLLRTEAAADRDVVVNLRLGDEGPRILACTDGNETVVALSAVPGCGKDGPRPRVVDVLVDCSGSMSGTSIAQARSAVGQIIDRLRDGDAFNVTRFGSGHESLFRGLEPVSETTLSKARAFLRRIDADMGGTELASALDAVYGTGKGAGGHDILLVTDGDVWAGPEFYAKARASGCRVFPVGVGCAPAEPNLRRLARETGGEFEACVPGEGMDAKIVRHFERMSAPSGTAEPLWPGRPLWVHPAGPVPCHPGDTLRFFAAYDELPEGLVRLQLPDGTLDRPLPRPDGDACPDLARMAARARILDGGLDDGTAAALAVRHGLLSRFTSYVLVDERAAGDRTDGMPDLARVPQMHAAGWGGVGHAPAYECCMAAEPLEDVRAGTDDRAGFPDASGPSCDEADVDASACETYDVDWSCTYAVATVKSLGHLMDLDARLVTLLGRLVRRYAKDKQEERAIVLIAFAELSYKPELASRLVPGDLIEKFAARVRAVIAKWERETFDA